MATQYRCSNENRRDAVRFTMGGGRPILNGIDYLEVASADEMTLEIHFIHNLPGQTNGVPASPTLTERNFVIEGGARVQGIKVKTLGVKDNIATLQVSEAGDYSSYILRLVASEETSDPPGYDLQLSAVSFSFKVECPTDFDCKPEDDCPPENLPAPLIDYLAKDYSSFRRLMLDHLSTIMPDWRERNAADMQIAMVEVVAYAGDYLSYYQDAVATESYLGTARQRISMRRHARLLDYAMHDGSNARAWVHFQVEPGTAADGLILPTGTPLLTPGLGDISTVAPVDYDKILKTEMPIIFETLHGFRLHSADNAIKLYTWDDTECCLPKGATRATLLNNPQLDLHQHDVIIFEEVISPATGLAADADPIHRHAVRLTEVITERSKGVPLVDPLHGTSITEITWDSADALPFPLCISTKVVTETGEKLMVDMSLAHGNIVLADHGQTMAGETIGKIDADASGHSLSLCCRMPH